MSAEKQSADQGEHHEPAGAERKIHHTHFPVLKIPLPDNSNQSVYEWVRESNGHLKLVRKKTVPRV